MNPSLIERYRAWRDTKLVPGFQKSWAWLAAAAAVIVAVLPDALGWLLMNFNLIDSAFPTLPPFWRMVILALGNVAVVLLRPIKQRNMPPPEPEPVIPERFRGPPLGGAGAAGTAAQIVNEHWANAQRSLDGIQAGASITGFDRYDTRDERQRADPGPGL